jgi:hypothetical protein
MIGRERFSMSNLGIGANTSLNKLRFFSIALACSLHKVILTAADPSTSVDATTMTAPKMNHVIPALENSSA